MLIFIDYIFKYSNPETDSGGIIRNYCGTGVKMSRMAY
jgi:hypothetical protein